MMNLRRRIAAGRLAAGFLQELIDLIGDDKFRMACSENVRTPARTCASHGYCDANLVMDEAWRVCFDPEDAQESSHRLDSEEDCELWSAAWEIATAWMIAQALDQQIKMKAIHALWTNPKTKTGTMLGLWALSDGYGAPGTVPSQGYDWSGIRDSSEEAVEAMYQYVLRQGV